MIFMLTLKLEKENLAGKSLFKVNKNDIRKSQPSHLYVESQ